MSNFATFTPVTAGLPGSAPIMFCASTNDSYATITAVGYLNDLFRYVKSNDIWFINYMDESAFPMDTKAASLSGTFQVVYDGVNWSLVPRNLFTMGGVLSALGVYANTYSYAGGAASFTVADSNIPSSAIVIARFQSSQNAAIIEKVAVGNGSLTVLASTNPGASVLEYISVVPSLYLQNNGVNATRYSNAGGSSTITIVDPLITTGSFVTANFASSANAVSIETVSATAGTLTVVCTGNPGVSVLNYLAVTPSTYLSNLGLYAAQYTNAGGSATTSITDANISSASIVVADWASQASAVEVEKVTAGAGTLTVLSSGDPGASVLSYIAVTPVAGSSGFLPLAGGQMTGSILLDRGTATSTAGAATINHQAGVVTTESLTTASGSAYSFTLTNSRITTSSIVLCQLLGGTNTKHGLSFTATSSSGSATISVLNNDISAAALNGTLIFGFVVI